jgi:methyltransferase-like protein/SAM-dependent methyltransferase
VNVSPIFSYDELPYSSHPVQLSHPDNLACKAILHGLRAPDIETCRVLELGCGTGANLLSIAQILPKATLVGIDYAQRQIHQGKALADTVGIKNVELIAASLADLDGQLGQFDYIICHGVYSWVSKEIQQQILGNIKRHLAPNGIGYVSYNTYPGWHLRGLIREILCHQTKGTGDPNDQVNKARKYLDFLIQFSPEPDGLYSKILQKERDILSRTPDTYLYHEHLEETNQPLYFHEFANRLTEHQLQFLCEASYHPEEANFSEELRSQLSELSRDRIDYEQHVDFLVNGTFRRSLLCHSDVSIGSQPSTLAIRHVKMRSRAKPVKPIKEINNTEPAEFRGPRGETITTSHVLIKAALLCMSEQWPRLVSLDELQRLIGVKLETKLDPIQQLQNAELLSTAILRCYRTDLIQFHIHSPPEIRQVGERPLAPPLSRWQSIRREPISNMELELVDLSDFDRFVLSLLDGSRDRAAVIQAMIEHVQRGDITLQQKGVPVDDPELIATVVEHTLSATFDRLIDMSLLQG